MKISYAILLEKIHNFHKLKFSFMKTLYISILAFFLIIVESNASVSLFYLKDCIGKIDCPIKKIKTKQIGEYIYTEVHINTLSDKVSKGIKEFEFEIKDKKNPNAPPIYSFKTEQRLDVLVTFSFRKEKIEQIGGYISLWGPVLHETAIEIIASYLFEIKDYLKNDTRTIITDNKKTHPQEQ